MNHDLKALTVWQPWAQLLAYGAKRFETRKWTTGYRGPLVIHAAKRTPEYPEVRLMNSDAGRWARDTFDMPSTYALGAVIGVGRLVDVHLTQDVMPDLCMETAAAELRFGDFSEGRYAWELDDVQVLCNPVPCRGHQGLWHPAAEVRSQIRQYLPDRDLLTPTPAAA